MDRQHRHELKHDKFVDEIGALSVKARENQRWLLIIGVSAVVIAAAVYGFLFYRGNREDAAQKMVAEAIETFEAPVGEAQPGQAPDGPRFKTEQERTAAAEKQFKEVAENYSGTDAGDVANLYLARIAIGRNDTAAARKLLEDFVSSQEGNILESAARYSLYQIRIENGEAAQVITELNAELTKEEPVLPGDSLLVLLAQAYEIQGDVAKSREAYQRLATDFPESPYAVEAQRRSGQA
jgi:hypothetical protein